MEYSVKRVLVTGATGFIGNYCLPLLSKKGYEIHAVSSKTLPKAAPFEVHWHKADLLDLSQGLKLMKRIKPTHLLHLAWYVVPDKCWNSLQNLRWVQTSIGLLQAFSQYGGQRVVMAGTCAEYDWRYCCCSEQLTPLSPRTLYGASKHALQIIVDAFGKENGLSTAWGRTFFLYGPREHPVRLVSSVIRSLLSDKPARCSHGNQLRDYLYVQDVAHAFVVLLESDIRGPVNIASGYPVSLKEIVHKIAAKLNREDLVQMGALPVAADEPDLLVGDVSRLSNEADWRPEYDLDDGLEKTISWWRTRLSAGRFE